MSNPRFFAFGCSMTNYIWPTWADILSLQLQRQGYTTYNFGLSGIGNHGILCHMARANLKYQFTPDDIIIVVWSSWTRMDKFIKTGSWHTNQVTGKKMEWWTQTGNFVAADFCGASTDDYVKNWWSLEDDFIKNLTHIYLANLAFPIKYQASISGYEGNKPGAYQHQTPMGRRPRIQSQETINRMGQTLSAFDHYHQETYPEGAWDSRTTQLLVNDVRDSHPLPRVILPWMEQYMLPVLDLKLDQEVLDILDDWEVKMIEMLHQHEDNIPHPHQFSREHLGFRNAVQDYTLDWKEWYNIHTIDTEELWATGPEFKYDNQLDEYANHVLDFLFPHKPTGV